MESTVKLYSLNYSGTLQISYCIDFCSWKCSFLPQLFHLFPIRRNNMASILLLYSHWSLQIRMESRTAHSHSFSSSIPGCSGCLLLPLFLPF